MDIRPDGILGHSVGELGCAYADGSLTAEEAVLAAYWRGHCVQNAKLPPGGMAAVGKIYTRVTLLRHTCIYIEYNSITQMVPSNFICR